MRIKAILLIIAGLGLAGCGDTVSEQAIGGAAVGAGAAVLTSGGLLRGAAIGAGANVVFCQLNPGRC